MIDCANYRRAILADPNDADAPLREHRQACAQCAAYTERLLRFESRFGRALRVGAGEGARAARVLPRPAPRRGAPGVNRAWLAMAASVLIVVAAAAGLWLASPQRSLAGEVVAHMAEEPQAWARTDVPVAAEDLGKVLQEAHLALRPSAPLVSYAAACRFRGHHVPHLVVQTDMGPITVMVLVHERVSKPLPFEEEGYRGVILPLPGHGSLAVLAHGENIDLAAVERVAARVEGALEWRG